MRMDKLTTKFQQALADAQSLAVGRDNNYLEPVHVLQALLDQEGGSVRQVLQSANVNIAQLRTIAAEALDNLPQVANSQGDISVSPDLARILNLTDKLAQQRHDQYI